MKINWNTKYNTISVYTIITFTACILVYGIIFSYTAIGDYIKKFCSVIAPIIWGVVIAYLVNPIMKWIENHLKKIIEKKNPHFKLVRILSLSLSMILFLAVIAALGAVILPQVFDSISGIINNISTYINNFQKWVDSLLIKHPELFTQVNSQIKNIETAVLNFINNIVPKISDIMVMITDSALSFIIAIKDFLIGLIVAVYLLYGKERFQAQLKKLAIAILPKSFCPSFLRVCAQTNSTISGFISGKIVDSIIIGCLCFVAMTAMKFDFVLLISVIVGVTNVIPFFGPFIGAIPSAILLLFVSPNQVIPFLILILVIQQIDGNIIGPKILGQSTGISAFWVLFSILVGGGLFGFVGMLLGVPVFAVLYSLLKEFIEYRLACKELSTNTDDYYPKPEIKNTGEKNSLFTKKKNKK